MRFILPLLLSALLGQFPALAQKPNRVSLQAGYLYSTSTFTLTTSYLLYIPRAEPKPGFYVGLAYERSLSKLLTSQLELTYQQKGYRSQKTFPNDVATLTYSYLGVTPMLGVRPLKTVRFLAGPSLNMLLNRATGWVGGSENKLLEVGLLGRACYQRNRVGFMVGYFHGLTIYHRSDFHELINRNWQVGLLYQLSQK